MANYQTSASSSSALASTSVAGAPNTNYKYDVFINHRGPDVKKTFASHVYRRLLERRLRVFLDQSELQPGEELTSQIQGAIKTASVHVAIFSPKYAESRWCLEELVLMLKSGATIIPVFFHVKPHELRWTQGGVYAQAFRCLEKKKRYDPKTVEEWKGALSRVAEISGLELEACNGDEGELVDKVLQEVQKKVKKTPLRVAEYPTGLDDKLQDLEETILLQKCEVKVVGIVGTGGVGKTTLVKEFFNRKRSDYDQSCFVFDVREAAGNRSLPSLQDKLIKDLTPLDPKIDSIADGEEKLSHYLSNTQALIIFDDVDHKEQLDALFSPVKDVLCSGSLILVTSRDKNVLAISGIRELSIYRLTGLNKEHSEELFCSHAFKLRSPALGFEEVVRKFLDACGGLPLSLKVIGASLYRESPHIEFWEAELRKISRLLPMNIQSALKISYDNLDKEEKEIFLDTACFFIGENMDKAIRIWNGSGWEGSRGIESLENKCLVEMDSNNCIRMHDHLRDLGRELAEKNPGRLRLLRRLPDDICSTLSVRGINIQTLNPSLNNPAEISNPFVDVRGLQLLMVEGDRFESISNLLKQSNLLWLQWSRPCYPRLHRDFFSRNWPCQCSSLPSSIPIKNLIVLEVVGWAEKDIQLATLWENEAAPLQLRELIIDAVLLQLPKSIGQLKHLEKIELTYTIQTLPDEFFLLHSLKHLRMRTNMKLLPNAFGNLTNLQHLNLTGCNDLQLLPNSLGNLTDLRYLNLSCCSDLIRLPDSFRNLIRLEHLCLEGCSQLTLSSETLGNITTLESLDLSGCWKMEVLPPQVTRQLFLQNLNLCGRNLKTLKELPSAIGNLSNLEVLRIECSYVESYMETLPPTLGSLRSLKQLALFSCTKLKCLPDSVGELKQMTHLMIDYGKIEYLPAAVTELNNLEVLKVSNCPLLEVSFTRVGNVAGKNALVDQCGCRLLDSSVNKCMLRLKHLDLQGTAIMELSFAQGVCPILQQLNVSRCSELVEVGALPKSLILLDLNGCDKLKKVTGLCGLAKLRELDLRKCKEVEELSGLETLISLVHLRVSGCGKLKSIRGLAQATNLRRPSFDLSLNHWIEGVLCNELTVCKAGLHEEVDGLDGIPSFDDSDRDWIELLLFKDLRVSKEGLNEEDVDLVRWVNELQSEREDHYQICEAAGTKLQTEWDAAQQEAEDKLQAGMELDTQLDSVKDSSLLIYAEDMLGYNVFEHMVPY